MRKNNKRPSLQAGFTLIELLMVIVIIGLLSSIILASLNSSRNKTLNTKIRTQLNSARTSADLYHSRAGNYGQEVTGSCTSGGASGPNHGYLFRDTTSGMALYATASNYPMPTSISLTCYSNGVHWAMSASLVGGAEGGFTYWCVDSRGNSKGRTGPAVAQTLTLGC